MKINEILHILHNPYGFSDSVVREASLAADEIEKAKRIILNTINQAESIHKDLENQDLIKK